MTTVKRFPVGETKCQDDGQALLFSGPYGMIISLEFGEGTSRDNLRELDRLLTEMKPVAVEVQTEEPMRVVQNVRRPVMRRRSRRSPWL